jgi:hypothetical protein
VLSALDRLEMPHNPGCHSNRSEEG